MSAVGLNFLFSSVKLKMFSKSKFFVAVVLLLRFASSKSSAMSKRDVSSFASAFENLTQTLFTVKRRPIIINFGLDIKIVDEIILKKLRKKNLPVQLENRSATYAAKLPFHEMTESAILTFDSWKTFVKFFTNSELLIDHKKPFLFYVYAIKVTYDDYLKFKAGTMRYRNSRRGINGLAIELTEMKNYIYFVTEEGDSIRLLTFVWHTQSQCNDLQLIEVNRFDKSLRKWKNSIFEMQKYETFHGCQLVIGVYHEFPAFWLPDGYDHQSYGGYNFKLIEGLAKSLNFTIEFNPLLPDYKFYAKNLTTDFLLHQSAYNLIFTHWNIRGRRRFSTEPYIFIKVAMAVPPGASYNGYEKLLLPFDLHTWSLILFTFFGAYFTILILNFTTRNIRKLVFGTNVTTPSLNVAAHFFGISQPTLPKGNFGRTLLTIFIFYCLIIRTAWQGKMFEFMQKDMRKPEVQSMEEMIERNFSFWMVIDFMEYYSSMDLVSRARITCDHNAPEYMHVIEHDIYDPSYEGGLQIGFHQLAFWAKRTKGTLLQRLLKEDLFTEMVGLQFEPFHVFFEIIDRKIQQLFTAGITNYYIEQVTADMNPKRYEHLYVDEPQVLTMDNLEAGFVTWLIALSLAIFIFMFEWIIRFKDFLVFKYVWIAFCKQKELQAEVRRLKIMVQDKIFDTSSVAEVNQWHLEEILPSIQLE